jgi:hypothetical protein
MKCFILSWPKAIFKLHSKKEAGKNRLKPGRLSPLLVKICAKLSGCLFRWSDSFNRALFGACSAFGAEIRVDYVFVVALADGLYRAHTLTGSTGNALIRDKICHFSPPL